MNSTDVRATLEVAWISTRKAEEQANALMCDLYLNGGDEFSVNLENNLIYIHERIKTIYENMLALQAFCKSEAIKVNWEEE